jgi:hypothetical protein
LRLYHFRDQPDAQWLVIHTSETSPIERRYLRKRVRLGELELVARYADEIAIYRQP